MKRLRLIPCVALLICGLLSPAGAADTGGTLIIPTILSLTGQAAFLGNEELQAVHLLETQTNKSGGIHGRKIHFDVVDDQSTPQLAVQLATAAIATKAPVVLGPMLGSTCAAVTPLFAAGPVDYCLSPALHPPQNGYVFSAGASTTDLTAALVRYARGRHLLRVAILTTTDATGQDGDAGYTRALSLPENRDVAVVARERYSPAEISITAQMVRINAAKPDMILTWFTGTPTATALHAYADAGMNTPIALNNGNLTYVQMHQFASIMPKDLVFAAYRFLSYETLAPGPLKNAQQAYYTGFGAIGIKPDIGQSLAWDPGLIALSAHAQLSPSASAAQFRDYILGMRSFVGVNGLYNFSDGSQRGLTQNVCIVVRWDAPKEHWVQISEPGGKPLLATRTTAKATR
jgi:branched-chain amino acid transport system substrate-binding protein